MEEANKELVKGEDLWLLFMVIFKFSILEKALSKFILSHTFDYTFIELEW